MLIAWSEKLTSPLVVSFRKRDVGEIADGSRSGIVHLSRTANRLLVQVLRALEVPLLGYNLREIVQGLSYRTRFAETLRELETLGCAVPGALEISYRP